jgi:carbonic anhydrase
MSLDGNIEHLRTRYDVGVGLVVGYTKCGVLEDAHEQWVVPDSEPLAGIEARLDPLCSLIRDRFEERTVAESMPLRTVRYRLVEFNVHRQIRFLRQALPRSVTIAGYIHDQNGAYSSFPDKRYLVAPDGETDPQTIRVPENTSVTAVSLL